MSLGEDYLADYSYEIQDARERIRQEQKQGIWTQKDGTKISVRDMSRGHIKNTIAMLRKGGMGSTGWIDVFEKELAFRDYVRKCANENW